MHVWLFKILFKIVLWLMKSLTGVMKMKITYQFLYLEGGVNQLRDEDNIANALFF